MICLFISPWQQVHLESNYFMPLIPNETPLENSVVPGHCVVETIALGILLRLEPDWPVFCYFTWKLQVKFKKRFFFLDTSCFWLELQSNEAGKK